MWLRDNNIRSLMEVLWKHILERTGNKAFVFFKKLQFVKEQLKKWNRESFKNIFNEKLSLEEELKQLHEQIILQGMDETTFLKEKELNKVYCEILAREETFWRQKSRETWLKEGDKNTKFFHSFVKVRRTHNNIFSIKNMEGELLTNRESINREAIGYFLRSFDEQVMVDQDMQSIMEIIPTYVKEQHNKMLLSVVSSEEVKYAVFGMGSDKAPGPDGFPALFFFSIFGTFWLMIYGKLWRNQEQVALSLEI
ncbi:uncharacterized protein LOC131031289 [Cryptomeria japonica]|uniref:uncharacterized protein LOC131031289 n=1 Tax=Cryptomeria japonica TaxID=3369 RepID=UPI0027DA3E12|nr:uncharacterized protein LOC131031289 [Cryptomeria japonica]